MKKLRYFFEYILVKLWFSLLNNIPLKYATIITSSIFKFIGMKLRSTKTADKNLMMVFPELTKEERVKIIREVWENLAYTAAETSHLNILSQEDFEKHVTIKGLKNIEYLRGKRAIFFSAHLANWELIGKALMPYKFKFHAVYRKANNKLVNDFINKKRAVIPGTLVAKGKDGAKKIIQALQNDQHIYMLVDQKMNDGIKVPFLGHDAMTAPAIANLAKKYDCPIIPVQVIRTEGSYFELIIHPEIKHQNKNVQTIMLEINDMISSWIKANPGQWFWLHRRWINK